MTNAEKQKIIDAINGVGYNFSVQDSGSPLRTFEGDKVVTVDTVVFTATKRTEVTIPSP